MEYYITSDKIQVFPSAFRSAYAESKRTTEENLLKFNRLSGNTNNLNQMFEDPDDDDYVIFNIHGYWFRCLIDDIPETPGEDLYAYIKIKKEAVDDIIGYKLSSTADSDALDDAGNFTGLAFASAIPTSADVLVQYYGVHVKDASGNMLDQKLKLDSTEIRNVDSTKSISEEFTTETINTTDIVATGDIQASTINATNSIEANTIEASTIEADQVNVDRITKKTAGSNIIIDNILETPAPDSKTITINGDVTIGAGGFETGTHKITLTTSGTSSNITLPISGTLATLNGDEALTSKTINGVVIEAKDSGLALSVFDDGSYGTLTITNGADVNISEDVNISAKVDIGGDTTGKVSIKSAGSSPTTIIGPDDGTATLIAGTYGSAALLNNVAEGAQVNIIETFEHNNTEILPVNKKISITTGPNIYFGEDDPTDPSQVSDIYVNILDGKIYMMYGSSWSRFPEVYVTIAKETKTATLFDTYGKVNLLEFKSQRKVIAGENVLYIDARFRCIKSGGITYSTDTTAIALSNIDMEEGEFLNFDCLAVSSTEEVKFLCGMSTQYTSDYGGLIIFKLTTPPGGNRTLAENDELVIRGEFSVLSLT